MTKNQPTDSKPGVLWSFELKTNEQREAPSSPETDLIKSVPVSVSVNLLIRQRTQTSSSLFFVENIRHYSFIYNISQNIL